MDDTGVGVGVNVWCLSSIWQGSVRGKVVGVQSVPAYPSVGGVNGWRVYLDSSCTDVSDGAGVAN